MFAALGPGDFPLKQRFKMVLFWLQRRASVLDLQFLKYFARNSFCILLFAGRSASCCVKDSHCCGGFSNKYYCLLMPVVAESRTSHCSGGTKVAHGALACWRSKFYF